MDAHQLRADGNVAKEEVASFLDCGLLLLIFAREEVTDFCDSRTAPPILAKGTVMGIFGIRMVPLFLANLLLASRKRYRATREEESGSSLASG